MSILKDSYNSGNDGAETFGASGPNALWKAQTWTATATYTATVVRLKLYRVASGTTGTITISLRATDGANKPSGADLATSTYDGDTLTTDTAGEWIDFTLNTGVSITSGVIYAIVVRALSATAYNGKWNTDTGNGYAGGTDFDSSNGTAWTADTTDDSMFEIHSAGTPTDKYYSRKLVAIGGNEVWYESAEGTMSEVAAANSTINTENSLDAAEAFQKLFVANTTTLKVLDFVNVKLSTADIVEATKTLPLKGDVVTATGGAGSGAVGIVDYVNATDGVALLYVNRTSTASFTDTDVVTGTNANGNIQFTLDADEVSAPHWYDWTPYANDTTTYGSMPSNATLVARYRGRLVLSGHSDYPHQWWMCKTIDPWNWIYGDNDPLSAVAGQDADAGELGDIIRALIPYGDDYMVIGGSHSMHLVTGDPAYGGSIDEVSENVGIWGPRAWCKDSNGNLYFLGNDGLYRMDGGRSKPVNISAGALPKMIEDLAIDPDLHRIVLDFDPLRQGIIITRTTLAGGANTGYWFSLKTEGFYPESYAAECGVYSAHFYYADNPSYSYNVYGCADGYLRYFLDTAKNDDSGGSDTAISSYLATGPFPIGDGVDSEGKIKQLVLESAGGASSGDYSDTDGFSYNLYIADDAETVAEDIRDGATANLSGTITGTGRKSRIRQNTRGQYGAIKISNSTPSQGFGINRILIEKEIAGRLKDV